MKSYFKFLSRNMLYTLIEVFGLAIALTFILIISKYTKTELNIDKFHENADNIYALANEEFIGCAYGLPSYLLSRYPEIEQTCAVYDAQICRVEAYDDTYDVESMAVDTTFLSMFSFELIEGERDKALSTIDKIIISEELANKIFKGKLAVNKTLTLNWGVEKTVFIVGGVFKKIQNSSIKNKDLIFNVQLVSQHLNASISNDELGNAGGVILFIQTKPGTDFASKSDDLHTYFKDFYWIYKLDVCKEVKIIPLKEIYFSQIKDTNSLLLQGDKQFVLILSGVALFILLFALINYINLTVAQTGFRAKEMAMRRLLGSSKTAVIIRFISEAVVLTLIAFVIALFFCELFKPFTMRLLGREVDIFYGITTVEILVCFALVVIIGLFAGIIPAMMISRYKPIDVVKGTFRLQSKMVLGKVFVVIQNVVTITMLALTLALFLQTKYLINRPLGYKTENIMNVDIPSQFIALHSNDSTSSAMNMLKSELEQIPYVKRVGFARGNPCANFENQTFQHGDDIISLMRIGLDTTAFSILGFEVISQNSEQIENNWWLTEGAMRDLKADYTTTELELGTGSNMKLNGIIKDFIPLWMPVEENSFVLFTITSVPWNIILETTGNQAEAKAAVKEKMEQLTQSEIDMWYSREMIEKRYEDQRNLLNIILIFTIITIIISTLGLIAMSTYYTRQRSMEVAVRKVFGSSSWEMFTRLTGNFLKLLIISFVIALPIAWFLIDYWLKDYSYRINISPLIFVVAGFVTLLIAAAAISWQSARAANANPVETVKKQQQ